MDESDQPSLGLNLDRHRERRTGHAEAVYAPGKTPEQVAVATAELARHATGAVFVTRATPEQFAAVAEVVPGAEFDELSRLVVAKGAEHDERLGSLAIVCAGTSDLPVAEEAARAGEALGIAVAGITTRPVVAVPTSVGYGASFQGLAALLAMLSSCAPGITVVNIDNGFGAALAAHRILRVAAGTRER